VNAQQKIINVLKATGGRLSIQGVIRRAEIRDNVLAFNGVNKENWSANNAIKELVDSGIVVAIRTPWGISLRLAGVPRRQ